MSSTGTLHEKLIELRKIAEADELDAARPFKKRKSSHNATASSKRNTPKNPEEKNDKETGDDFVSTLKKYKEALDNCRRDTDKKQEDFETFKGKIDELHAVYLYGLKSVSSLQDLRYAPDAILPGNFPKEDEESSSSKK